MYSLKVKNINIKITTYLMFPQKLPTRGAYIVDKEDIFSLFPLPEDFFEDVITGNEFSGGINVMKPTLLIICILAFVLTFWGHWVGVSS